MLIVPQDPAVAVVAAVGDSLPPLRTGSVCQQKYGHWCFFLSLYRLLFIKLEQSLRTEFHSLYTVEQKQGQEIVCPFKLQISKISKLLNPDKKL